ncbi:glycosyltransferase family 2 protein, partial [Atractiella rhizophila]
AYVLLTTFSPSPRDPFPSELTYITSTSSTAQPLPSLFDKPSIELSIIVPAYNEVSRLPHMLRDALSYLTSSSCPIKSYEFLLVDDGSSDGTAALALELATQLGIGERMRVVKLERNRGKGGAVRHGMMHARGEYALFVDADGATAFGDLQKLWEVMMEHQSSAKGGKGEQKPAVVIGSRAHLVNTEAVVKRSVLRNLLMRLFHLYLLLLGLSHIRDTQCGFKLFSRSSALLIFPYMHTERWIFDCEILILASLNRIPVSEVGVRWKEIAGSKVDVVWDSLVMARDLAVIRANYLLGRWGQKTWKVPTVPKKE